MADNVTLNPGSGGALLATDEIANVHFQIVKLAFGPTDTASLVTTLAGLPVQETRPGASATTEPNFAAVSDTTRNVALLPTNANRRSARLLNHSSRAVPVSEGGVASPSSYAFLLPPATNGRPGEVVLDPPCCTAALNAYFGQLPDGRILVTERT